MKHWHGSGRCNPSSRYTRAPFEKQVLSRRDFTGFGFTMHVGRIYYNALSPVHQQPWYWRYHRGESGFNTGRIRVWLIWHIQHNISYIFKTRILHLLVIWYINNSKCITSVWQNQRLYMDIVNTNSNQLNLKQRLTNTTHTLLLENLYVAYWTT